MRRIRSGSLIIMSTLGLSVWACGDDPVTADGSGSSGSSTGGSDGADTGSGAVDSTAAPGTTTSVDGGQSSDDGAEGSSDESSTGEPPLPPPLPPPAYDTWIKIELPDTYCSDQSQYKFFVNWHEGSDDLVVIFEPGGACWDWESCSGELGILGAANPNGIPDDHMATWGLHTPQLSRIAAINPPLHDWNMVFMPYCTGDVFTGNNQATYDDPAGGESLEFWHVGHPNMMEVKDYLAWQFQGTDRLYLGGCSAGGVGANVNYYYLRDAIDPERGYLVNDSGPLFPNSTRSAPLFDTIRVAWDLDPVVAGSPLAEPLMEDFGAFMMGLSDLFPEDRLSTMFFIRDYNFSRYSYERFWMPNDQDSIHAYFLEDAQLLMAEHDLYDNVGYFLPYYRFFNDSHCATLITYLGSEIDGLDAGGYIQHVLDDDAPLESYVDLGG